MLSGLVRGGIVVLVFSFLYLSQRFWFLALWKWTEPFRLVPQKVIRGVALAGLGVLVLSFMDRMFGGWLRHSGPGSVAFAITQLWMMAAMFAYVLVKLVRGVEWLWFGVKDTILRRKPAAGADHDRRAFFRQAARLAAAIPVVAAVYGYADERFDFTVRRVEVPVANLPAELDGLQIAQLSDIHIGDFMPRYQVRRAVEMANDLGSDLTVVTGDFLTGPHDPLADCIAELARLRAPLGVWGCNGNHEIYANAEDAAQRLFAQHGMKLLRQERAELAWRGAKFNLIGVDYQRDSMTRGPKRPMLEGMETLVRRDMPNILLSHNPNSFYKAAQMGIELSLAGHTHGGQVAVEILDQHVNPARFVTQFIAGQYQLPMSDAARRATLYVNRGLGTIGVPARLGVDPEITLMRLRRA